MSSTPVSTFLSAALGRASPICAPRPAIAELDLEWARSMLRSLPELMLAGAAGQDIDEVSPERLRAIRWVAEERWRSAVETWARSAVKTSEGGWQRVRVEDGWRGAPKAALIKRGSEGGIEIWSAKLASSKRSGRLAWMASKKSALSLTTLFFSASRHFRETQRVDKALSAQHGVDRKSVDQWQRDVEHPPRHISELIEEVSAMMGYASFDSQWVHHCLARELARKLYPEPAQGRDAARLMLSASGPQARAFIDPVGMRWPVSADRGFDMQPGLMALCAAFGPVALGDFEWSDDVGGRLKKVLRASHGLSEAGWKILLKRAQEDAEFPVLASAYLQGLAVPDKKRIESELRHARRGAWDSWMLKNGCAHEKVDASESRPPKMFLSEMCQLASLCAQRGWHPRLAFQYGMRWLEPSWQSMSDRIDGSPMGSDHCVSLGCAPLIWIKQQRDIASAKEHPKRPESEEAMAMIAAWKAMANLAGMPKASELDPAVFAALAGAGWTPENDAQRRCAAIEAERIAARGKSPAAYAALMGGALRRHADPSRWKEEAHECLDWLRAAPLGLWVDMPEEPTLAMLKARASQWHEDMIHEAAETGTWDRLVEGALDLGPGFEAWEAKELASGVELTQEGRELRHCVGGYARKCKTGKTRIFSLRGPEGEKSTLELALGSMSGGWERGRFRVAQHRGIKNRRASSAHEEVALRVMNALRKTVMISSREIWTRRWVALNPFKRRPEASTDAKA